jgi:dihydroorotate dehydrogenase electron transfer subunit
MQLQEATFRGGRATPPFWTLRFAVERPPTAGRFVLADLGGAVREVLFPSAVDEGAFESVVAPGHPATRLLPGTPVSLLGPGGRGFRVEGAARLLLVAEVEQLPSLYPLLQAAPAVAVVVEAPGRALLPSPGCFPPSVELHLVTEDGSVGHTGRLEALLEEGPLKPLLTWADRLCSACDPARYPALARSVRRVRLQPRSDFAQALVRSPLPCGVGACEICRIPTRSGERHVCTAGPVFDLLELDGR